MKNNKTFYILYFLFFVMGCALLMVFEKGDLVMMLNQRHNPFLDSFFYYWTNAGDGLLFAFLLLVFLFLRYSHAIALALTALFSTIIVQLFKRVLFSSTVRPKLFFEEKGIALHFVDGLTIHGLHSFPSGHTATAFALATLLSYVSRKNILSVFYFFAAVLVAVSRVYLCQHFFVDVFFGSLMGVLSTLFAIELVEYYRRKSNKHWMLEGRLFYKNGMLRLS